MAASCVTNFLPPLPSRTKLMVTVKMALPRWRAWTVRVAKLLPSRTCSTWYRMGISASPASTK